MEDADGEESGGVENAEDHIDGGKRGPDDVRSVPVLPWIGRLPEAGAEGVPVAVTGLGRARSAPGEGGEEGLLLRGGLCDRDEEHGACPWWSRGGVYEDVEGADNA